MAARKQPRRGDPDRGPPRRPSRSLPPTSAPPTSAPLWGEPAAPPSSLSPPRFAAPASTAPRPLRRALTKGAELYTRGTRGDGALDEVTARYLREQHALDDDERGVVVEVAQGMWRNRRRLEHIARALPFDPSREALACLWWLLDGRDAAALPIRGPEAAALADVARAHKDLTATFGLPPFLLQRLQQAYGDALEPLCRSFLDAPPMTLRANTLRASVTDVIAALAAEGHGAAPGALGPDAVVLERRANVFRTAAFRDGLFEVQDEGSQLISLLVGARPGDKVVDGCAGAGGKSLHLAAQMQNKGTLWAFDVHQGRLAALARRAARAGAQNVRVHDVGDDNISKRLQGKADAVLVDAPCSGLGVLRRNPDTTWRIREEQLLHLRGEQETLLARYARLVAPGGRLVYATCSVLPEENADIVDAFLTTHPEFQREHAFDRLAAAGVDEEALSSLPAPGPDLHLDPRRHRTDGFYAAVLVRSDDVAPAADEGAQPD